jgi:acyl-CoA thioester hydrolase
VGIFQKGDDVPVAVGGYTHVFVDRNTRKSTPMLDVTMSGLAKLLKPDTETCPAKL